MDLEPFGWAIGISDILGWRECPQRFVFGMRRHLEIPERLRIEPGERDEPPESINYTNVYGSAIHHAIHLVDKDAISHERAIAECMKIYGSYLMPQDVALLREDLNIFEQRRPLGVTLVASEADMRVPLFVHEGQQIWFRFKVDALYRLIANPAVFVSVDYKSSAWRKTQAEVHSDLQAWSYNFGIHDYFPECEQLLQRYDQLKFGIVQTTKNDEQRADIKRWLIDQVKAIIADETYKPKINDFCRYCALVVTCREPRRAAEYTRGKLALLAPLTKEGRKVRAEFQAEGAELRAIIAAELPEWTRTRKHLEHVEKVCKELLITMPEEERFALGWRLKDRKTKTISSDGLRELHEYMGDSFYELVNMSISRLEDYAGKPKKGEPVPPELQIARKWQTEDTSGTNLVPANSGE